MNQLVKSAIEFSVIILAAGKSSRMGIPKWSLMFTQNNSFIENVVSEYYRFGCKEIIVVINESDYSSFIEKNLNLPENIQIVINSQPDWHRFYSLKLGVKSLSKIQFVFIHNIDNPFVNHEILDKLVENSNTADLIIPEFEGRGGHPIFISRKIIADINSETRNQIHFKEYLQQYSTKRIKVNDERILLNINTSEEYQQKFNFS